MNKFGKFLDETQAPSQRSLQPKTSARQSGLSPKGAVSVKINASTLKQLKFLKTIEAHRSYAELVDHLLEDYLEYAGPELKDKMTILQNQR